MSDLTKQYFDKQLGDQTKEIKSYVNDKISYVGNRILFVEAKLETEVADLVGMVSRRFDDLEKKLDLRAEVDELKVKMRKV